MTSSSKEVYPEKKSYISSFDKRPILFILFGKDIICRFRLASFC